MKPSDHVTDQTNQPGGANKPTNQPNGSPSQSDDVLGDLELKNIVCVCIFKRYGLSKLSCERSNNNSAE